MVGLLAGSSKATQPPGNSVIRIRLFDKFHGLVDASSGLRMADCNSPCHEMGDSIVIGLRMTEIVELLN